ncbi:MAG: phosphoenolpyruvate synthase, partial [Candidatus Firestonebacteria bacterium]|nr:phosphoenolpyruvate synthase [Candidatus Firestonebacteria bacterium]
EAAELPIDIQENILQAYSKLQQDGSYDSIFVAVRSSATAEDLPSASFAGMHDSFLYVSSPDEFLNACRKCYASLYTERAIRYREHHKINHQDVKMAIVVQKMISSDNGCSGVAFTVDIETGFENGIVINSVYGLGEGLVKGYLTPDEYFLFKPALEKGNLPILSRRFAAKDTKYIWSLKDNRIIPNKLSFEQLNTFSLPNDILISLGQQCLAIEKHFSIKAGKFTPMDIEWVLDNNSKLWIVQARPITTFSQKKPYLRTYILKERSKIIVTGQAIGKKIGQGSAIILSDPNQIREFKHGNVLVTDMTDPAWMPIMKKASAIVTNRGGRTCHAAIVSREMGLPCIIGTTNATEVIRSGQSITVSCIDGDEGKVFEGLLKFEVKEKYIDTSPTKTKLMFLTGLPDAALVASNLPSDGVAMGREEFIIYSYIGIHPFAFIQYEEMKQDIKLLRQMEKKYTLQGADKIQQIIDVIEHQSRGYKDKVEFFVEKLAEGMAKIAASVYPKEVYMKLCDFKTNEFRALVGGFLYEPIDNNPMIGWRSASRYYSERYRPVFELECRAFKRVREDMGFSNMHIMIPFCRSVTEAKNVVEALRQCGIVQHKDGLLVTAETEVPSSVIEAIEFAKIFDMFNIGSNDLAQMVLGTDRDSELLAHIFDERNPAVLKFIKEAIDKIHSVPHKIINGKEVKVKIGLTGVAVSNYPEFARFLIENGIDYIGLDPDPESFLSMRERILEIEREIGLR